MARATNIKKGMVIRHEGQLYLVIEYEHLTPGNKRAIHQVKMKNLMSGAQLNLRLSSSDTFEEAFLEKKECQFLYKEGEQRYVFMRHEDFEQFSVDTEVMGSAKNFLVEGKDATVVFYDGRAIFVELPASVILKVIEAEDAVKGNSVTNLQKMARVETGYEVKVPLHVKTKDLIKISTETGEFQGRAKED